MVKDLQLNRSLQMRGGTTWRFHRLYKVWVAHTQGVKINLSGRSSKSNILSITEANSSQAK